MRSDRRILTGVGESTNAQEHLTDLRIARRLKQNLTPIVVMPMKTYNFRVVVEPDEDLDGNSAGWHAYCPLLEQQGASTWGLTESEALSNLSTVVRMVVESMLEHGEHVPEEPADQVEVTVEPRVAITV
jgi:predicted RNase H-like HicB family nuclease